VSAGPSRNSLERASVTISAVFLAGCIALPIPHDHPYSPGLSGTVVDAETSKPIAGAVVSLEGTTIDPPIVQTAATATDGTFSVLVSKRQLWLPLWFGPAEGFCTATATVSAPGYVSQTKEFRRFSGASGSGVCGRYREMWSVSLAKSGT
jgi:hypothetical protein